MSLKMTLFLTILVNLSVILAAASVKEETTTADTVATTFVHLEKDVEETTMTSLDHQVIDTDRGGIGNSKGGGGGNKGGGGGGGGGKSKKKKESSIFQRLLPYLIIPFVISSAVIPKMLLVILALMVKAALVAKGAITMVVLSHLSHRISGGGVYDIQEGGGGSHRRRADMNDSWMDDLAKLVIQQTVKSLTAKTSSR